MFVKEESIARLIDAFVNSLYIEKYGVKTASVEGHPSYDSKSLYKHYIYGSRKGIRSSRKLAESYRVNLEVKWMLGGVEPDFCTVLDFRKNNIGSLKEIFNEFNRHISGAVEWEFFPLMEETGESQLFLTDADAKLMKNKNDFTVVYNPQTAVDQKHI